MSFQTLPAGAGWHWLKSGAGLCKPLSMPLVLASFVATLIGLGASLIPIVGQFVAGVISPLLAIGLLSVVREVADGENKVSVETIVSSIRKRWAPLLTFGVIYGACLLLAILIADVLTGGGWVLMGSPPPPEIASDSSAVARITLSAISVYLLVMIPAIMAYTFAPILIGWHDQSAGRALLLSFVAVLKNWKAFLVNGLCVLGVVVVLGFVLSILIFLLPLDLIKLLAVPLVILMVITSLGNLYYSYKTVFAQQPPPVGHVLA